MLRPPGKPEALPFQQSTSDTTQRENDLLFPQKLCDCHGKSPRPFHASTLVLELLGRQRFDRLPDDQDRRQAGVSSLQTARLTSMKSLRRQVCLVPEK